MFFLYAADDSTTAAFIPMKGTMEYLRAFAATHGHKHVPAVVALQKLEATGQGPYVKEATDFLQSLGDVTPSCGAVTTAEE